ncbi:hypothetical protein OS493_037270 [Desmophyllum pertusum]|uniref:Uncharacterized protein n=1 Tax=Desmophyllum pertusum TaxID=174260 RepID=A0A9W9YI21_9CNID|nr:hypothetical protein OS493_037270 [Desmophyllum pertusum]
MGTKLKLSRKQKRTGEGKQQKKSPRLQMSPQNYRQEMVTAMPTAMAGIGTRTKERGNAWKGIADSLNDSTTLKFKVNTRAVRERFSVITAHYEDKTKEELAASGISPEFTPYRNHLRADKRVRRADGV